VGEDEDDMAKCLSHSWCGERWNSIISDLLIDWKQQAVGNMKKRELEREIDRQRGGLQSHKTYTRAWR